MIEIRNLCKSFTLHNQGAAVIPVMTNAALSVARGECVGLIGASGAGKSTLMRMVWSNYLAASGLAYLQERTQRLRTSTMFKRFLDPRIVAELTENSDVVDGRCNHQHQQRLIGN